MAKWERISVELSHTWPGQAYLRFEGADGTATMVAVDQDDLARVAKLENALGKPATETAPYAELTLDDGSVVYVPEGLQVVHTVSGRRAVQVPCRAVVPAGRKIARAVVHNTTQDVESPWVYQPPTPVPLSGYLEVDCG